MSSTPAHIDLAWIMRYTDMLLDAAKRLEPGPIQDAVLRRVEAIFDLLDAWKREHGIG